MCNLICVMCVCECIYVYNNVYVCSILCVCMREGMGMCMHVWLCIYNVYVCIYSYICMYVGVHVCKHVWRACVGTCMSVLCVC